MILTFQSALHGQCGTTVSMIAIAFTMKNAYPDKKILLVHSQSGCTDLERLFKESKLKLNNGIGFSSLFCQFKARPLTIEDVNGAIVEIANGMYLLPSDTNRGDDIESDQMVATIVTQTLPEFFDFIFVDIGAGRGFGFDAEALEIIKNKADINFFVCSQNPVTQIVPEMPNCKVLIGNYDKNRKNNVYVLKDSFGVIPYCSEYADALAENMVAQFFGYSEHILDRLPRTKKRKSESSIRDFLTKLREISVKIKRRPV